MAIKLVKPINREIFSTTMQGENLIITLEPGDLIIFRVKGKRQKFEVPLAHCFNLAQILESSHRYNEQMRIYNEKKKAGYKVRKPKKVDLPFNKIYYKAITER